MIERFTRGNNPRSTGSGLGLALVEQQAQIHGGTLTLDQSPLGGLAAALTLRHSLDQYSEAVACSTSDGSTAGDAAAASRVSDDLPGVGEAAAETEDQYR